MLKLCRLEKVRRVPVQANELLLNALIRGLFAKI
jgi:hypothetical protein